MVALMLLPLKGGGGGLFVCLEGGGERGHGCLYCFVTRL
jgi:hypothetical protein